MRERFGWIECLRATQRLHNEASDPFLPFWSMLPSRMHKYFKMDVGDGWAKSVLLLLFVLEGWVWVMVIGFDAAEKQAVALQKHKQNTHIDTQGTQFSLKDETVKDSILREHPPSNKACKPPPEMRAEWVEESEVPPDPPAAAVVRGDKELGKRSRSLAFARAHARTHTHTHTHTHQAQGQGESEVSRELSAISSASTDSPAHCCASFWGDACDGQRHCTFALDHQGRMNAFNEMHVSAYVPRWRGRAVAGCRALAWDTSVAK